MVAQREAMRSRRSVVVKLTFEKFKNLKEYMQVVIMLNKLLTTAKRLGDGKNDQVASLAMEALEHMECMLGRLQQYSK